MKWLHIQVATHEGSIREKPDTEQEARQYIVSYRNSSAATVTAGVYDCCSQHELNTSCIPSQSATYSTCTHLLHPCCSDARLVPDMSYVLPHPTHPRGTDAIPFFILTCPNPTKYKHNVLTSLQSSKLDSHVLHNLE
jgi:hypothetical protein